MVQWRRKGKRVPCTPATRRRIPANQQFLGTVQMKSILGTHDRGVRRLFATSANLARAAVFAAVLVSAAAPAEADVVTWKGAAGAQDWTLGSNWSTGGAPGANDTALFPSRNNPKYVFSVTPPADFVGTITATNYATGDSAPYSSRHFDVVLQLGVADGAAWKVDGTAALVATDGLAARIAPTFAGTIDVRKGTTFALPATLNAGVTVVGAGKAVLASTAQLPQVSLFAGDVVLPSGAVAASAPSAFAAASTELADGQTVSFAESALAYNHTGVIPAPAADSWTFNGGLWENTDLGEFTPSAAPPHLDEDGSLLLTDDPAQCHAVWYSRRTFRSTDDWGMSFTWTPELPNPSRVTQAGRGQTLSGNFGIVFQRVSDTAVNAARDSNRRTRHADHTWGFFLSTYRDGQQGVSWTCDGVPGWEGTINRRVLEAQLGGVMLNKAIDFTVAMVGGKMSVTMVQGEKSCSFAWNFKTAATVFCPGGYWVGFTGTSDDWGTNATIPWSRQRIADFSGWYRDPLDGGWEDVSNAGSFSTLSSENYESSSRDKSLDSGAGSAGRDFNVFNADGSVQLSRAVCRNGVMIVSKSYVETDKRLKVVYDIQGGGAAVSSGKFGLGFLLGSKNSVTWTWSWGTSGPYGYGWGTYAYGFAFELNQFDGTGQFLYDHLDSDNFPKDNTQYKSSMYSVSRSDDHGAAADQRLTAEFVYDPDGSLKLRYSQRPGSVSALGNNSFAEYALPAAQKARIPAWIQKRSGKTVRVGIRASSGINNYVEMKLKGIDVKQMTSLQGGRIPGALRVPDGASATVVAGEAMEGQTAPVMIASSVELGAGASLTVAPETATTIFAAEKVAVSGRATLAPASGASLRIDALALDGPAGETGLTATGATFPEDLVVTIPDEWTESPAKSVGRHEIANAAGFPNGARIVTASGRDVTNEAKLKVLSDGSASIDFTVGFILIVR